MVKVALVTSWNDRCGISEYAKHLVENVQDSEIQLVVVAEPIGAIQPYLHTFDIFQLNCCGFTMQGWHPDLVAMVHGHGKKIMLTLHDSSPVNNVNDFTKLFDKVVVHEPRTSDGFVYVPQGAPVFEPSVQPQWRVGTSGIPQARKNLVALAQACGLLGQPLSLFTPATHHADVNKLEQEILAVNKNVMMNKGWLSDYDVISGLADCAVLCYPYLEWNPGPSAAAMFGVSARRPIVVSRTSQFDHWRDCEDEIYFINSTHPSPEDIALTLGQAFVDAASGKARVPQKIYEEHRWDKCADIYVKLWKGLL